MTKEQEARAEVFLDFLRQMMDRHHWQATANTDTIQWSKDFDGTCAQWQMAGEEGPSYTIKFTACSPNALPGLKKLV